MRGFFGAFFGVIGMVIILVIITTVMILLIALLIPYITELGAVICVTTIFLAVLAGIMNIN